MGYVRATYITKKRCRATKQKDKGESENRDPNNIKKMDEDEKRGKENNGDIINKNKDNNNKKLFGQKNTSGITFTDEEIQSLEEGRYVIDSPIQYVVEMCKENYGEEMEKMNID